MAQDAKQGDAGVLNPADSQGARDARANVGRSHGLAVICMVCMLILAYLTPNRGPFNVFTAVAGVLVTLAFAYSYPFSRTAPTPAIPKAAAVWEAVAGLVLTMIVKSAFAWLALMGLVTVLMIISAFLAELLREKRLHLISSLGTTLWLAALVCRGRVGGLPLSSRSWPPLFRPSSFRLDLHHRRRGFPGGFDGRSGSLGQGGKPCSGGLIRLGWGGDAAGHDFRGFSTPAVRGRSLVALKRASVFWFPSPGFLASQSAESTELIPLELRKRTPRAHHVRVNLFR